MQLVPKLSRYHMTIQCSGRELIKKKKKKTKYESNSEERACLNHSQYIENYRTDLNNKHINTSSIHEQNGRNAMRLRNSDRNGIRGEYIKHSLV